MTRENVYIIPSTGEQKCRTCIKRRSREQAEKRRAERGIVPRLERTQCRHGHPYIPENRYIAPGTGRSACRICMRENVRAFRARRKGAVD